MALQSNPFEQVQWPPHATRYPVEIFNKAENIISTSLDHEIHFDFIFSLGVRCWRDEMETNLSCGMMGRYETSLEVGEKKRMKVCTVVGYHCGHLSNCCRAQSVLRTRRADEEKNLRESLCVCIFGQIEGMRRSRHFDIWKGKANTSSCISSSCIVGIISSRLVCPYIQIWKTNFLYRYSNKCARRDATATRIRSKKKTSNQRDGTMCAMCVSGRNMSPIMSLCVCANAKRECVCHIKNAKSIRFAL